MYNQVTKMQWRLIFRFIAFACNKISLAIAFLVVYFIFFLLVGAYETDSQKFFFFFNVSLFITQEACDQDQTYKYNTSFAFMPCALKISSNSRFR